MVYRLHCRPITLMELDWTKREIPCVDTESEFLYFGSGIILPQTCGDENFLSRYFIDERIYCLNYFHLLAVVNSTAVNICICVLFWIPFPCFDCILGSRIAGLYGNSVLNFWRNPLSPLDPCTLIISFLSLHLSQGPWDFIYWNKKRNGGLLDFSRECTSQVLLGWLFLSPLDL